LDYIGEVMVVGVEDEEFGQRVAAAVTLKEGMLKKGLSLARLRSDLRERLAGYKMPTVLRVLEGEIPKSGTGKVQKKMLGPRYFGDAYRGDPGVQVWEKEVKAKL
jgi:acyl-CoA synthetase (AMP-forming)/AMP-acid ligase II